MREKLEEMLINLSSAGEQAGLDLFWLLAHNSAEALENNHLMHHTMDSLFTKPANLAYILDLVYLNTYADFVGISGGSFPPKEVMSNPVEFFLKNDDEKKVNFEMELLGKQNDCEIYRVMWNSILKSGWKENDRISAQFYVPEDAMGITIAVNGYREPNWIFQKRITRRILKRGSAVLYLPSPFHMKRCPKKALNGALMINYAMPRNTGFAQFPIDIMTAVSYLTNPKYNKVMEEKNFKTAYIGTSLGAIMGLWTFLKIKENNKYNGHKFREFDAFISIIGGINIPEIIKESALFRDLGNLINPHNRTLIHGYDPGSIIERIDTPLKNMYAIIAEQDTVVPTKYQKSMVKKLGVPEENVLLLPIGHSNIFLQHREIEMLVTRAITTQFDREYWTKN